MRASSFIPGRRPAISRGAAARSAIWPGAPYEKALVEMPCPSRHASTKPNRPASDAIWSTHVLAPPAGWAATSSGSTRPVFSAARGNRIVIARRRPFHVSYHVRSITVFASTSWRIVTAGTSGRADGSGTARQSACATAGTSRHDNPIKRARRRTPKWCRRPPRQCVTRARAGERSPPAGP